jgi:hypothetical protein
MVVFNSCSSGEKPFFHIEKHQLSIDTQRVSRIDFYVPEHGSFTVTLTDSGWVAFEKGSSEFYPADISYLGFFLGEFVEKRVQRVIQNPSNPEIYGFSDDNSITIDFYDFDIYLGRLTLGQLDEQSLVAMSTLTRVNSDTQILSINNMALSYFNRGLINWRDKAILRIPRDSINTVTYTKKSETIEFNRFGTNDWRWGNEKLNYATYNRLELALGTLNTIEFQKFENIAEPDFTMDVKKVSGDIISLDFYRNSDNYVVCMDLFPNECFTLSVNYVYENLNRVDKTLNIQ